MCRVVDAGQLYFRHWSHVEKINRIFTVIKQSFKGNFIELDFSENINEKTKWEYNVLIFLEPNTIQPSLFYSRTWKREICVSYIQ